MNEFLKLLEKVDNEDTTILEEFIEKVNTSNTDNPEKYLTQKIANLSITQLKLIKGLSYKGGFNLYIKERNFATDTERNIAQAFKNIPKIQITVFKTIDRKYLKYFTTYMRTKWRQQNPTNSRKVKGTEVTFGMNEFSLQIFKQSITKKFLRNEVKNLLLQVNKAFKEVENTQQNIKIRNKFYYIILNNAKHVTKIASNTMYKTTLLATSGKIYLPDIDEALAINPYEIFSSSNNLRLNMAIIETRSTDVQLITAYQNNLTDREINRKLNLIMYLLHLYTKTTHEPFKFIAENMVKDLPEEFKQQLKYTTKTLGTLKTILKEQS